WIYKISAINGQLSVTRYFRRDMRKRLLPLLILPSFFVGRLQAQTKSLTVLEPPRLAENQWHPLLDLSQQSSAVTVKANDYRWEGMAIGAGAVGVVGALIANGLCNDSDTADNGSCTGNTIGGALLGAGVGAVIGVFLGSFVSKGT
ncbi:MAG TPA: hypothetical protein VFU03_03625, partial [Gemmatimonadales bacterium]|nr:hypothetical protein [Gemmatimonadales bacterium]